MALYIQKSTKKDNIFKRLFKSFNDDDIFYAGGEAQAPAPQSSFTCELVPPYWASDIPEAKTLRLSLIFCMVVHVGFMVAHIFVLLSLMFAFKEILPLYICFYGHRTMNRFILYLYCILLMVSGALGIFSFFNMTTYTFFSILLYIGELVIKLFVGFL